MRYPLTPEEHERIRFLLTHISASREMLDDRLITLGLVRNYSPDGLVVMGNDEVIGPDGCEPYIERSTGQVNPISYPTIGEEDALHPGRYIVRMGDELRWVTIPPREDES